MPICTVRLRLVAPSASRAMVRSAIVNCFLCASRVRFLKTIATARKNDTRLLAQKNTIAIASRNNTFRFCANEWSSSNFGGGQLQPMVIARWFPAGDDNNAEQEAVARHPGVCDFKPAISLPLLLSPQWLPYCNEGDERANDSYHNDVEIIFAMR